jgi:hypothetical protein
MAPNQVSIVFISTQVFVSYPEITLWKGLCGKAHSHDAKSMLMVKDLVIFL